MRGKVQCTKVPRDERSVASPRHTKRTCDERSVASPRHTKRTCKRKLLHGYQRRTILSVLYYCHNTIRSTHLSEAASKQHQQTNLHYDEEEKTEKGKPTARHVDGKCPDDCSALCRVSSVTHDKPTLAQQYTGVEHNKGSPAMPNAFGGSSFCVTSLRSWM